MIRSLIRSVIHNATVTHVDPTWPAALRIDVIILRAAEILPLETVEVINLTSGERFRTWAEPGEEGSGEVRLHAGVRNPMRVGDLITIACFGLLHDGQTLGHHARIVTLDGHNRVIAAEEA